MRHLFIVSQRLETGEAHIPAWNPASRELASNHAVLKPQVGLASFSPTSTPIYWGKAGAQEAKKARE